MLWAFFHLLWFDNFVWNFFFGGQFQICEAVSQRGYRTLNSGFCKPSWIIGSNGTYGIVLNQHLSSLCCCLWIYFLFLLKKLFSFGSSNCKWEFSTSVNTFFSVKLYFWSISSSPSPLVGLYLFPLGSWFAFLIVVVEFWPYYHLHIFSWSWRCC